MKQTARYIMKNVNKIMKCYNRILSRSPKNVPKFFALEWFAKSSNLLKSLIACDRNRDWERHLQIIQKLLPIFGESDSINYLKYASIYLEKMRRLPIEYPEIYRECMNGNVVAETQKSGFNGVSPDMKLEQTIQGSKKSPASFIGQTRTAKTVSVPFHKISTPGT